VQKESPKTRFELRFDAEVYDAIAQLAEQAGISVNQLMQGVSRWAVSCAHLGDPPILAAGAVENDAEPQPGCIWFGRTPQPFLDEKGKKIGSSAAEVYFSLDFTERRVVREAPPKGDAGGRRNEK
jgi:hypothetical protein